MFTRVPCCLRVEEKKLWTILTMSLPPFWALNVSVALLSMQGQKALGFHQKYLNLCSEDEQGLTVLERHEGE